MGFWGASVEIESWYRTERWYIDCCKRVADFCPFALVRLRLRKVFQVALYTGLAQDTRRLRTLRAVSVPFAIAFHDTRGG